MLFDVRLLMRVCRHRRLWPGTTACNIYIKYLICVHIIFIDTLCVDSTKRRLRDDSARVTVLMPFPRCRSLLGSLRYWYYNLESYKSSPFNHLQKCTHQHTVRPD